MLVAKGYAQQEGIDYEKNICSHCKINHNQNALATQFGWNVTPDGCQKCIFN